MITAPMRDRFGVVFRLDFYQPDDLKNIVMRSAGLLEIGVSEDGAAEIEIPGLEDGAYRFVYSTKDEYGAVYSTEKNLVVAGDRRTELALPALLRFDRSSVAVGETARLFVFTGLKAQEMVLDIYRDGRRVKRRTVGAGGSGIVDFPGICTVMLEQFQQAGGFVHLDAEVTGITEQSDKILVHAGSDSFHADRIVVCAGLMADRLTRMQGLATGFRIIPYRGEYYRLRPDLNGMIEHLVYPIPDPNLPFLGVHLTRMIDGSITVGPNAVQGWKREGYGRLNFSLYDTAAMLTFPGFWKATARHLRHGISEVRNSLWKPAYVAQVKKYCPKIEKDDLEPHPAGIRAQAVLQDGTMVHDFLLEKTPRSLHVCNAPSPAATSAIPIGRHICDLLIEDRIG